MARGATRRTWIKLYVTGMLHGSIRYQLEPDERATWVDLLLMAGECSQNGNIADNDGHSFPLQYMANHLNIPLKLLEKTLKKCEEDGRINSKDGVLNITNWDIYQPDYKRQQVYRAKKKSRDPRQAPYETEEDFKERLKLFEEPEEEPDDDFQARSDALVKQAISYHTVRKE